MVGNAGVIRVPVNDSSRGRETGFPEITYGLCALIDTLRHHVLEPDFRTTFGAGLRCGSLFPLPPHSCSTARSKPATGDEPRQTHRETGCACRRNTECGST